MIETSRKKIEISKSFDKLPKGTIFSVGFFLLLVIAGALSFCETKTSIKKRASVERRKMASLPANPLTDLNSFKAYPKSLDSFLSDNFGFRLPLIRVSNFIAHHIFGDMPTTRYFRGTDGWFFRAEVNTDSSNDLRDMLGQVSFTPSEIDAWISDIKKRSEYFEKLGAKYTFGIAPRKDSVYPEFLPKGIGSALGLTRLAQLSAKAKLELPYMWVDLFHGIKSQKNTELFPRLYFLTDSHLNYVGAYYGYRTFFDRLNLGAAYLPKDFRIHSKKDWKHDGFQSETGLKITEPFPSLFPLENTAYKNVYGLKPRRGEVREGQEKFAKGASLSFSEAGIGNLEMPPASVTLLSGEPSTRCRRMTQNSVVPSNKRVILLTGDSFLEKIAPFFAAHAEHTYFCRQILVFDPPVYDLDLKIEIKPDIVIQGFVESYLLRKLDRKSEE